MAYDVGKSLTKSVKYPLFAMIAGVILKLLEVSIAGFDVEFPEVADIVSESPEIAVGLGVIIFIYDYLKHKVGVRIP